MQKEIEKIIVKSIGMSDNYFVENIDIDEEQMSIDIIISSVSSNGFECPECHAQKKVYDKLNKKWRHIDFAKYKVYVRCMTPRIKCEDHGVKLVDVSWAKQRHQFTYGMEEFICELADKMPLVHVSTVVGEHDTRIRRIVKGEKNEKND